MENQSISDVGVFNVLFQWILFSGLLATLLVPAFLFQKLAKQYKRKSAWTFFLFGFVLGGTLLSLSKYILLGLKNALPPEANQYIRGTLLLVVEFFLIWISVRLLKKFLASQEME